MAKKEVQEQTTAVATGAAQVPAVQDGDISAQLKALGATDSLVQKAVRAHANIALMESPKLPKIKPGTTGLLLDAEDPDAKELQELTGVIIYGAKFKAWYEKQYTSGDKNPPDCFSTNGKAPSADAAKPQSNACKGCAKNEFETAASGKGKACRDLRQLFLLLSVEPGKEAIMPIRLTVTPTSLKAFDDYLAKLTMYGMQFDEVVTKITARQKSRDDKYCVLAFSKADSFADKPEILGNVRALQSLWGPYMERAEVEQEDVGNEQAAAPKPAAKPGEF